MVLYKRLGSVRDQFWSKFNKLKGNANRNSFLALLTVDAQAYRKNPLGDLIKPYNQLNTKETMQNVQLKNIQSPFSQHHRAAFEYALSFHSLVSS